MIIIGIDPGATGGVACLSGHNTELRSWTPQWFPMPTVDKVLDPARLADQLRTVVEDRPMKCTAVVERGQAMPKQGVSSSFAFGRSCGIVEGVVAALGVPIVFVRPRVWQKVMHAGVEGVDRGPKEKSAIAARRLFPGLDLRPSARATKQHEGVVDALLIAEWYRRQMKGGA